MITDTDRINWIITNKADIDAPIENETWIVYTQEEQFDGGVGSSRDLRKAIDLAMQKTNKPSECCGGCGCQKGEDTRVMCKNCSGTGETIYVAGTKMFCTTCHGTGKVFSDLI